MENFTPWSALAGGSLIGLAAALLLLLNGRIAGISGMLNSILQPRAGDTAWRAWFLGGLVLGAFAWSTAVPLPFSLREGFPLPALLIAGFLVGFGTRMGSGCTSGHGVCGIARLSRRSLLATATFMVTALLTVALVTRNLPGVTS